MAAKMTTIQKALRDVEAAWNEMKITPVNMSVEEFEKRVLRQAKREGTPYSTEPGKWLDMAKKAISDSNLSQEEKNLYFSEAEPPELKPAVRKFLKSFLTLCRVAEWSYKDLKAFCDDHSKDERLRAFLRWRALPPAEALHKFYLLQTRGEMTKEKYLKIRPTIILRNAK